ncbi:hypothetical protein RHGRI_022408 [Rhododendron griersonianum]|uniref:RING-type E3 ubiquitin transferase n=1 Tax=Rhododendron griersonianum TaxID=479676 RepID=A0AAV6J6F2_9ERIC|nr:hypothetical protein RHGRI_022408 [Rhododendron griersonianum]
MGIYLLLLILSLTVAAVAPPPFASAQTTAAPPPYYPYSNVNAVGGFIFLVVLAASLITCVLCACCCVCCCGYSRGYSRNTTHRRIPLRAYAAAASRPLRLSLRGLDPAAINSFPLFIYSEIKNHRIGKGELSCAVCVSEFEDNERLRLLPKCDHAFHPECIDPWLASHSTCPICRANLSQGIESTRSKEECMSRPELSEVQNQNQISITVDEIHQRMDTDPRERVRTFPRPHSTGHSLVQLGEDCERYTLRLPEEVRRQVNRLDQGGRSDRWFCMTPPFSRTGSLRSAKVGVDEGDFVTEVTKLPFECLASKSEPMPSRPPV